MKKFDIFIIEYSQYIYKYTNIQIYKFTNLQSFQVFYKMNRIPLADIVNIAVGDMLTGQDGNKYIVCDEAGVTYWKPVVVTTKVIKVIASKPVAKTVAPTKPTPAPKPVKKVKEVKEKYYWKDNNDKPRFEGEFFQMGKSLKPKVSPNKFPAGYVWTTKFRNISYVVDIEYVDYSTTSTKFWNLMSTCPPCLDAEDYPYEEEFGNYHVNYDEQGNKFWCESIIKSDYTHQPLQHARKFPEGTTRTGRDGNTYVSHRNDTYDAIMGDACWIEE